MNPLTVEQQFSLDESNVIEFQKNIVALIKSMVRGVHNSDSNWYGPVTDRLCTANNVVPI